KHQTKHTAENLTTKFNVEKPLELLLTSGFK
ncbi:ZNF836 isoform 1, partial [Pongo abelii]